MRRWTLVALILTMTGALGACHGGGPSATGTGTPSAGNPATGTGPPPATPAPAGTSTGADAGSTGTAPAGWSTGPVTVTHEVPVPPVPVLTGIRTGTHPGYDRVTFDITGRLPGYDVRYVSAVVADGSGEPVSVPGRRYLQILFRPAQAHDASGTAVPRSATLSYPTLRGYVVNGDFEGVVTVTLGLADTVGFRVGELSGRVYLDVAA